MTWALHRRHALGSLSLLLGVGALLGAPSNASETSNAAGNTSLALSGDPASRYWPGLVAYLTTADGTFTAQKNYQNGVTVRFQGPEPQRFWWLDFAAPGGAALAPGLYSGAGPFPVQPPDRPGLSVSGEGLGCDPWGSFEILEVAYGSGGVVLSFHARFEQHCLRSEGALVGDVRYAAQGSVSTIGLLTPTVEKTRPLFFEPHAFSQDLESLELTAPMLPDGAIFSDAGGGGGEFSWTPGFDLTGTHLAQIRARAASGDVDTLTTRIEVVGVSSLWYESEPGDPVGGGQRFFATTGTGSFTTLDVPAAARIQYGDELRNVALVFAAPGGAPLAPGTYPGAMRYPYQSSDRPGLLVITQSFCDEIDGSFEVMEVKRGAFGEILAFWATFEQKCLGAAGGLRGEIRYRADVPVLVRAPETLVRPAREPMGFDVRGFAHGGQRVSLVAEGLPPGSHFEDRGDSTGRFTWAPGALDAGRYQMTFGGTDEESRMDFAWSDLKIRLPNDDFDGAYVILGLPFRDEATTLTATRASDDPSCDTYAATVWYAFTPATDQILVGSTAGSDYRTTVSAYLGAPPFPDPLLCAFGDFVLEAHAGMTYYFMVNGRDGGGRLEFSLVGYPPFEVGVAVDPDARLDPRSGDVTVGGTVTCSRPAPVMLNIALVQGSGGSPDRLRAASIAADCTGTTRWSATLPNDGRRLQPRAASLLVEARAQDNLLSRSIIVTAEEPIMVALTRTLR